MATNSYQATKSSGHSHVRRADCATLASALHGGALPALTTVVLYDYTASQQAQDTVRACAQRSRLATSDGFGGWCANVMVKPGMNACLPNLTIIHLRKNYFYARVHTRSQ